MKTKIQCLIIINNLRKYNIYKDDPTLIFNRRKPLFLKMIEILNYIKVILKINQKQLMDILNYILII
jgi:hypothetical protein